MGEEQQTKELKNTVKIKDDGPCRKKVTVEIPQEKVKNALDEQYESLRKEALVPGFRKGRAPRRLLEKRFGKESSEQVKLKLIADASDTGIKDKKLDILRDPDIDPEKIELPDSGPLKFEFEIEVRPEFSLPELEAIAVNKSKLEVTDEQITKEIELLRKYSGVWAPRGEGRKVKIDDQIIADAALKVEGVEEHEKLSNIEIYVRQNGFVGAVPVEKLDEVLVGAGAGQSRKTSIEVSKTYFKEEYRGKKIDIQITIRDIKYLKPAELNENFFKRFGVENEKELQEKMRDMLHGRAEQQVRTEMAEQIYKYLLDNTKFDLPLNVVAEHSIMLLQRQYGHLLRQGLAREQIEEQKERLQASSEEQAKEQLKIFFIMDKVADKLGIEVTEEEINGHIAQLAIQRGQRPERMREEMARDGSLAQFRLQVRDEKCIAKLLESAKIKESAPNNKIKREKPAKQTSPVRKKIAKKQKTVTKKKTGK